MQEELGMTMNENDKAWMKKFYSERDAWYKSLSPTDKAYIKMMDEYAQWQANMDEQRSAAQ
jgi:hypothetical protein